jgi:hypothetical protein
MGNSLRARSVLSRPSAAFALIEQEARALLERLGGLRPFALQMTMVTAAAVSPAAQSAIENHLIAARENLRALVEDLLRWLRSGEGRLATPEQAQRRFTLVRLRFNTLISQFDIFADVLAQRSEHETGVWIAGLDDLAADALKLTGEYYEAPPVICYVDRGHGAAIRRVRTRLPGGDENPVAIIRVPRERLVGSGIASSLVHEVGHQAAALLDLVNSLRPTMQGLQIGSLEQQTVWRLWERWVSEIVADLWSVARVGIAAPLGLIGVVSLPRVFVFRSNLEDPHPTPWIRVKLSCAMGDALYPHPQWKHLAGVWESFYPRRGLADEQRELLAALEATMPHFVSLLVNHRPKGLWGRSLKEALRDEDRSPERLKSYLPAWAAAPARARDAPPTLAFAVIGQARFDGLITPEYESRVLSDLLTHWATRGALNVSATCAARPITRAAFSAAEYSY